MIAPLLVFAIRLLIPLSIMRWPFWGMLLAIAADASDVIILDKFGWGVWDGTNYHTLDKLFDTYYLAFAVFMSIRWRDILAAKLSFALFIWRVAGVFIFEITQIRQVIFFAPNIFENFYLIVAGLYQFFPGFRANTVKRIIMIFVIAAIPKIIQEYIMHYLEFQTWAFFKANLFFWLY